jgi:hypothetical protein
MFCFGTSVLCHAAPVEPLDKIRDFHGVAVLEIEKKHILKKFRRTAHDPDTYDQFISLEEYAGIRFKVNSSKVELIELISDEAKVPLPYKIGDEYCSILENYSHLSFGYNFSDGSWIYLADSELNIKLWFDANHYMEFILGNMEFGKNTEELCYMNLSKIEILK